MKVVVDYRASSDNTLVVKADTDELQTVLADLYPVLATHTASVALPIAASRARTLVADELRRRGYTVSVAHDVSAAQYVVLVIESSEG